jgi:hypothetical protein
MAELKIMEVEGLTRKDIPKEGETILDDFGINFDTLIGLHVYYRSPEQCPWGRGNWIIDMSFDNTDKIFCLRLPKDMEKEKVINFVKPVSEILEEKLKKQLN